MSFPRGRRGGRGIPIRDTARRLRNAAPIIYRRILGLPSVVRPDGSYLDLGRMNVEEKAATRGEILTARQDGRYRTGSMAQGWRAFTRSSISWDDFHGPDLPPMTGGRIGSLVWGRYDWTTAATISKETDSAAAQRGGKSSGILRIETATDINTGSNLYLGGSPALVDDHTFHPMPDRSLLVAKIRCSGTLTDRHVWVGVSDRSDRFPDNLLADAINFIGFASRNGGSPSNAVGIVRNGITETTVDLGFELGLVWRELWLEWQPEEGGRVQFYVDGVATGSPVTTNLPADGVGASPVFGCRTQIAASRSLDVDFVGLFLDTGDRF